MHMFRPATNDQAFLKCGIFGRPGSGKTYTSAEFVIGFREYLHERKLPEGHNPVLMLDTETGSSWVRNKFTKAKIPFEVAKTRAFASLVPAIREAEKRKSILLIDSLTSCWQELIASYLKKKNRQRLVFSDWNWLKGPDGNGAFTSAFVNSSAHIIWCARAGFEYDFHENEAGEKELETTGIKPKAESEAGYEPSLLVLMTRHQKFDPDHPEQTKTIHYATILKDRSGTIDGKYFADPTFKCFLPHIVALELGGTHIGIDESVTSETSIPLDSGQGRLVHEQREIAVDEIAELLAKHYPGRSAEALKTKGDLLEKTFGSRSWERIKSYALEPLRQGRAELWLKLEGKPYTWGRDETADTIGPRPESELEREAIQVFG